MNEPTPGHQFVGPLKEMYEEQGGLLQSAYSKVLNIYGVDLAPKIEARTLPEYLFRKYQYGTKPPEEFEGSEWTYYHSMKAHHASATTKYIRSAIGILKDEFDVDILENRKALADPKKYRACLDGINEIAGNTIPSIKQAQLEMAEDRMSWVFARDIVNLFGADKATFRHAIDVTQNFLNQSLSNEAEDTMGILQSTSQIAYYENLLSNLSGSRYEAQRQLRELCSDDVTALLDFSDESLRQSKEMADGSGDNYVATEIIDSIKQELDFTVLPPGTQLHDVARLIVEESSEYSKAHVDLERLAVLDNIRTIVGPERCYLMRGKKSDKVMADEEGTLISEDYIGLIIQHHDSEGNVRAEDCIAISPIAKKHAGYIVRQDASAGLSWRQILSLPKNDAIQYFNARRLRFDPVAGESKYEAYVKKVQALLECSPHEFGREYVLQRRSEGYRMVHRGKPIGGIVLKGAMKGSL